MDTHITLYVQHIKWDLFDTDGHDEVSSVGSVNHRLTGKRKRIKDDEDGPKAKKIRQKSPPTDDEELRKKLHYLDEGPSRWGGYDEEIDY